MYRDDAQWQHIRARILKNGAPKKQIVREMGISRHTIKKMLAHEHPPGYGPRSPHYPKLGPFIRTIDQALSGSLPLPTTDLKVRDIVEHLRREEGFAGSYDSVRKYIRRRAYENGSPWEWAYDLIIHLPKPCALDFIRLLSRGRTPKFMSTRFQSFVREEACPFTRPTRPNRERQRQIDIEWMRQLLQKDIKGGALDPAIDDIPDLSALLQRLFNGRLRDRNRAMVVLASHQNIPSKTICSFLGVGKAFVRISRKKFNGGGASTLFAPQIKSNRKIDNEELRGAVFSLLHEPPSNYGINRTSWTMPLLCGVLKEKGRAVSPAIIGKMIKAAGYKWRKAKVVLTSNDPTYNEKLARIRSILTNLRSDEAFFSIDEYGPFAIKAKPGRKLAPPGVQPTVPQWQKSRGSMIMTAALELSGNQVTHFYSTKKNTREMIRMMNVLIDSYANRRKLYLSWDAASWHMSKQLFARIDVHNEAVTNKGGPLVETAPLPAGAQFLNVIESIFSGMARAIIHNSDYKSLDDAKAAIDRYFTDRNKQFQQNPRRAGKKLWGDERELAVFSGANNCKDPRYR